MPDISKCEGTGCPVKEKCYRFTSKPSHWQSYSDFWREAGEEGCHYMLLNDSEELTKDPTK